MEIPKNDSAICGGFSATYRAMCDFFNTPVREDVCWDISNLFPSNNVTEFNLEEFEQPINAADISALLAALHYNTFFTGVVIRNVPITDQRRLITDVADLLRRNASLQKIILSGLNLPRDGLVPLSEAILSNPQSQIHIVDFSNNNFDEKSFAAFAAAIGSMQHGLTQLDLSSCGINKQSCNSLSQALRKNVNLNGTLLRLNLSNNSLDGEGSTSIGSWLAQPNALRDLNLSNCNANLETILPAIVRGCIDINSINLSDNKLTPRAKQSLIQYLASIATLKYLNLGGTGMPADAVQSIVTGISSNLYLRDFDLSLANNKLGPTGATQLASSLSSSQNIISLDISDNEFGDEGIHSICSSLQNNETLRILDLSRNFGARSSKPSRTQAIESLINLINSSCPLESLVLQGSKTLALKQDIMVFLDGVGTNQSLKSLDISGNQMANKGAIALGKVLQTNHTLQRIVWDDNGTTLSGFVGVEYGLSRNRSLKEMPLPILDISASLKSDDQKKLQQTITTIQMLLSRNQNPMSKLAAKGTGAGAGMGGSFSQLSLLNSSAREQIERLRFKIRSTNREMTEEERTLVEDSENNDNAISTFHSIAERSHMALNDAVTQRMKEITSEILPIIDEHFRNMVGEIITAVGSNYKSFDRDMIRRLHTSVSFGSKEIDSKGLEKILTESASSEIAAKANEAFSSALEITTDYVLEKITDGLQGIIEGIQAAPQPTLHNQPGSGQRDSILLFESPVASESLLSSSSDEGKKLPPVAPRRTNAITGAGAATVGGGTLAAAPRVASVSSKTTPAAGIQAAVAAAAVAGGGSPSSIKGRGRALPAGLDPTKLVAGIAGRGMPPRPVASASPTKSILDDDDDDDDESKKKAKVVAKPKVAGKPGNISDPHRPPPAIKKIKKPKHDTNVIKKIPDVASEPTDLDHITRDRPMVTKKRKPPTRRPRGPSDD